MTLRAVIADDEPLARARLRRLLSADGVDVIAECANGAAALEAIRRQQPDVVFLDVEMPGTDGFSVVDHLDSEARPMIVFVTAYDRHAIRAFEAEALDYVVKPVTAARLHKATERARVRSAATVSEDVANDRFAVRSRGRVALLRAVDVAWIESAGNYVRLHTSSGAHLVRETLNHVEARLDPRRFARIHRGTIVNVARVKELRAWFGGDYIVVLNDGTELTLTRTYRAKAAHALGLK